MYLKAGKHHIPLRVPLLVIAGAAVVAVVVTVAVMLARRPADTVTETPPSVVHEEYTWVDANDLVVENELARGTEPRWVEFRPRKDHWDQVDVDEHWIDPREIGLDVLRAEVDGLIRRMLEDVP